MIKRHARKEDEAFIYSSFLKSFGTSEYARRVNKSLYYEGQHRLIEILLKNGICSVYVDEATDNIYGYVLYDRVRDDEDTIQVLHWVYVKEAFRRAGIAKHMIKDCLGDYKHGVYTHNTRHSEELATKLNLVYDPYLIYDTVTKVCTPCEGEED